MADLHLRFFLIELGDDAFGIERRQKDVVANPRQPINIFKTLHLFGAIERRIGPTGHFFGGSLQRVERLRRHASRTQFVAHLAQFLVEISQVLFGVTARGANDIAALIFDLIEAQPANRRAVC